MTPEQKLKWAVMAKYAEYCGTEAPGYPCANIDELYEAADDADDGCLQDTREEIREGQHETGLVPQFSRHYESKSVGMQMPDGSWVGWTYWYGGGKHGQPEAIDWMDEAYDLDCAEEEKVMVVRTFSIPAAAVG